MGSLSPTAAGIDTSLDHSSPKSSQVIVLRDLLAQQFPHLRHGFFERKPVETVETGVVPLDQLLGGGLPRGEFTELVARGHGSGSTGVIHAFLRQVALTRQFLVLVDGMGSFDPGAVHPVALRRLLWVRCGQAAEACKVMDLLLRDRNFPLLILDLKLNPLQELRKISASIWFRFARLLELNRATVLVITPFPLVSVAPWRLLLESRMGLPSLEASRSEILAQLRIRLVRSPAESELRQIAQAG